MLRIRSNELGDTIIEVLLAMTLLTLILFTSWGLVNRTTQVSFNARKRIEMVNQLKAQAEILKTNYALTQNDKDGSLSDILALQIPSDPNRSYNQEFCTNSDAAGQRPLVTHYDNNGDIPTGSENKQAKRVDDTSAVWIEYNKTLNDSSKGGSYVDFYVRGCWQTLGGKQTTDSAQFIVRLNL